MLGNKLGVKHHLGENFADGKGPGRPGDSQRHGIPKKATMAELEKASHAKGRKGQLARWQINMRRGKKKTDESIDEADWQGIKRSAKGAVAGAGLAGAAAFGLMDRPVEKPIQQPISAITQPAQQDSIPASMFNPSDIKPNKPIASTAQSANPEMENMLIRIAASNGIRGDELAAFLAQTAHETSSFSRLNELGHESYFREKYDIRGKNPELAKRLGNVNPGDGALYHGRGFVHLTGRTNYRIAGEALGLPLEKRPRLASDPEIAAKIAIWFWNARVRPNVSDWDDVRSVTRKINSGMAGLDDRQNNYDFYRKKLINKAKISQK